MADLQRTDEWFAARLGKVTASRIADVCARTKTGWGAARKNYMADLVAERLSGIHIPGGSGAARRWGEEIEPDAKRAYEFYRDAEIVEAAFIPHHSIANAGASPDGLVGEEGLVEFKCPTVLTHLETLETDAIAPEYLMQMQWQMACTGRLWCDFASYDPRYPESMKLYVQRVKRDDDRIRELEREVVEFLSELDAKVSALRQRYEGTNDNATLLESRHVQAMLVG